MAKLIGSPTPLPASGSHSKNVEEYVGLINTGDATISIARTRCPGGWQEPAKCPKFDEYAIVLSGMLRVEYADGAVEAEAGQAIHVSRDEWVRYSTPREEGAEYIAVCTPAFSRTAIRWEK
jgi:mannose-6-phosphate isomerase-like protein (cupin superfamily)